MMDERSYIEEKPPARTVPDSYDRILVGRREAARMLSISQRSLDYLVAKRELNVRRIGARVLISMNELKRYARADHPRALAVNE
jgi:excisionase family DNA binding protein